MKINEIFVSLSGESKYSGYRTLFIRTHSCPLRCNYCDSMYAVEGDDYKDVSIDEIMKVVEKADCPHIVLTGGEPLIQKEALELISKLIKTGHHVEIETSGAVDIQPCLDIDSKIHPALTVTMDWKCPSSGMRNKMLPENLRALRSHDVIKFVVGNEEDLREMARIANQTDAEAFASPIFGQIEPKEIAEYIIDNKLNDVRMQIQLHKVLWPIDMRGV